MSQSSKGFSPRGESHSGGASASRSTSPIWWVIAGVAALVSIALIVWLVVTSGSPDGGPTEPGLSSTAPTVDPTNVDPWEPGEVDWGDFPPPNVDSLPDLSAPVFPKTVGTYSFEKEMGSTYTVYASYEDEEDFRTMSTDIDFTPSSYAVSINKLAEPMYLGGAVCGVSTAGSVGRVLVCVMAGQNETVRVGTADDDSTVEDVAAFANEIYGLL